MSSLLKAEREKPACLEATQFPVQWITHPAGYYGEKNLYMGEILFLTEGSFSISFELFYDLPVTEGSILLLPPGSHVRIRTGQGMSLCVFRLNGEEHLPQTMSLRQNPDWNGTLCTLPVAAGIKEYLHLLRDNYEKGLTDADYLELKKKELLYLLYKYYSAEQLSQLFNPLLGGNSRFMDFVLKNYRKIRTVREFAALYNCSISNFEKKFRYTFGISPYRWMSQKRTSEIYQEIISTDKSMSQIAEEQKFLSLPQFTDYCKKHLGHPPRKLRRAFGQLLDNGKVMV